MITLQDHANVAEWAGEERDIRLGATIVTSRAARKLDVEQRSRCPPTASGTSSQQANSGT